MTSGFYAVRQFSYGVPGILAQRKSRVFRRAIGRDELAFIRCDSSILRLLFATDRPAWEQLASFAGRPGRRFRLHRVQAHRLRHRPLERWV